MTLLIKSVDGKILARIEEKDFDASKPLVFFLTSGKDKHEKVDIKYLRCTGSSKLVLN